MKKLFAAALVLTLGLCAFSQEKVYLWPKKTGPGSEKVKVQEQIIDRNAGNGSTVTNRAISGVTQPYFEIYKPAAGVEANKRGILIIPGGAYQRVVYDTEGIDYVKGYTDAGYTCFVLVYRTPNDGHKNQELVALQDAQRAIRIIKANAKDYGVYATRIGVMGSSAGGHVAASLANMYDAEVYKPVDKIDQGDDKKWTSAKPAFQFLIYPVITMQDGVTHNGSRKNLLGEKPSQEQKDKFSFEKSLKFDSADAFIIASIDDKSVNPEGNAIEYFKALRKNQCKAELHIFPESGHGFGVKGAYGTTKNWQQMSIDWLKTYQN